MNRQTHGALLGDAQIRGGGRERVQLREDRTLAAAAGEHREQHQADDDERRKA